MLSWKIVALTSALAGLAACSTDKGSAGVNSTPPPQTSGASATPSGGGGTTTNPGLSNPGTGTPGGSASRGSVPTLVSVNLQNVLNNLSVSLQVNRNSIPVTAQVPIDVAASVCGVSVDALAASVASGRASCTATTTSAQLNQIVQQQISTGGNVQGGPQTLNTGGATPR